MCSIEKRNGEDNNHNIIYVYKDFDEERCDERHRLKHGRNG